MKNPNKKRKTLLFLFGILGLILLSTIMLLHSPLFEVGLSKEESHLEIGTKMTQDPSYYLDGDAWSVALSMVDTSKVKETEVGRYPVYIYHGFQKFTSYVNVTDTTAPIVRCGIKNKTIKPGESISIDKLGLDILDYSEIESILFTKISSTKFYTGLPEEETVEMKEAYRKGLSMAAEEFQFSYGGVYTLTISVSDTFHNTSEITLTLLVEEPPIIEAPDNFYVADTAEINFAEYVNVWDFISEDISTDDVEIDSSQLNLSKTGTYEIYFTATDDYGLTASESANVHVSSQDALQELINTHAIDLATDVVIGADNPFDSGYYASENISFIQNIMLPSIVHIENDALQTFGSGFILEISDEFVTIATNEHVIKGDLIPEICFFDAVTCNGAVVASHAERDIAFIRIPIEDKTTNSSLSSSYVKNLRTVHINKGYWDGLEDDCKITIGYNCINEEGKIWNTGTGYIVDKIALRDWNNYEDVKETIISLEPIAGTSGSALFDGYGRLVGMIRGYTEYNGYSETVAVPLDELLTYFEVVFKYKIHYQ